MAELTAAEWNERHPNGTPVLSWVMVDRSDEPLLTRTRSAAWELGDGTPVVSVDGRSGGYALSCAEPLATDEQRRAEGWLDPEAAVTISTRGRYRLVGPDGVWTLTGLSTAGDTAELHLRREPNEGDTDHG